MEIESKANTWSSAETYKIGKQVRLETKLGSQAPEGYNGATNEDKTKVPSYYVCIKENKNKNPRISPEHWVKDECSKNLEGCKCRFGEGVLPFGGFPGTEKFGFSG